MPKLTDDAKTTDVSEHLVDGWFVFSDGLSSQQPHDKHRVVLGRYVERGEG